MIRTLLVVFVLSLLVLGGLTAYTDPHVQRVVFHVLWYVTGPMERSALSNMERLVVNHQVLAVCVGFPLGMITLIFGLTFGLVMGVQIVLCVLWFWGTLFRLIGALLLSPFSWKARWKLKTGKFVGANPWCFSAMWHGYRGPTSAMSSYAQDIARSKGITLTQETLGSYNNTRSFLNQHSGRKF